MKTQYIFSAAIAALLLASCAKPNDDPSQTDYPEPKNFKKKFMVKRSVYSGSFTSTEYTVYGEDSVNHNAIYALPDTTRNAYTGWHYDDGGRLVKVVSIDVYFGIGNQPLRDSAQITRPNANTIRWSYSPSQVSNPITPGPRPDEIATITDLGSSRRLVTMTHDGVDPATYQEKLYLNTYGGADSSIYVTTADAPGIYNFKRELFYNSDHQPNTQIVTVGTSASTVTTMTTSTITRDQHEHAYLHAFINRLHGSDLIWLSFSPFKSYNPLYMGGDFTDRVLLLNGSVLTMTTEQKRYNNGILQSTQAMPSYQYTITYDLQGRILVSDEKRDNVLTAKTEFTYYE